MRRHQTFHEALIPLLIDGIGAKVYLELGVGGNATIKKVNCTRIGVDKNAQQIDGVAMYEMTTSEFIEKQAAFLAPFDVCFIDADHDPLSVLDDFNGIWPHISDDGLVLCHDVNPDTESDTDPGLCGNAWQAAKEICKNHEAVVLPYHPGLLIVRKRARWGPQ